MLSASTQSFCLLALTIPEAVHGNSTFSKAGNSYCMQTITPQHHLYASILGRGFISFFVDSFGFIAWNLLESLMSNPI